MTETCENATGDSSKPSAEDSMGDRFRQVWQRHGEMLTDAALAFAVSRIIFYSVAIIAIFTIPEYTGNDYTPREFETHPLIDASLRWDAGWYIDIARDGYEWTGGGEESVAFFPLFPMLLKGALLIIPDSTLYLFAVLLNHAIFFVALLPVWLYAYQFGGRPVAQRTLLFLCLFPTGFFFNAVYTEALFLLLSGIALLALHRSSPLIAGIAGFLASLTRPAGVLLGLPFLIHLWRSRSRNIQQSLQQGWPIVLVPLGLAVYMGYLWYAFGRPLGFLEVQEAWGHVQMLPTTAIVESFRYLLESETRDVFYVMGAVNTFLTVWALVMAIVIIRSDSLGSSFAFGAIMMPLVAGVESMPVVSMARYVLVLFPLFIPLAIWARNVSVQWLILAVFLPLHVMLLALFVRWYWVV
ncbi:MAG: mannosyltransferase family protein [Thermomicrobiaceae bacterium]